MPNPNRAPRTRRSRARRLYSVSMVKGGRHPMAKNVDVVAYNETQAKNLAKDANPSYTPGRVVDHGVYRERMREEREHPEEERGSYGVNETLNATTAAAGGIIGVGVLSRVAASI